MRKTWVKKLTGLVLALVMALALVPALSLDAWAANPVTAMMNGAKVTWEDTGKDETKNALVVSIEAKHGYSATQNGVDGLTIEGKGTTNTKSVLTAKATGGFKITFTNPLTTTAKLFFTYKVTSKEGTFKLNGTSVAANTITLNQEVKKEESLAAGKSYTIEASTASGSGTVAIVLSKISLVEDKTVTMNFEPASGGSYTVAAVDGQTSVPATKIDAVTSYTFDSAAEYTLKATAESGKEFVGWQNVGTGKFLAFSSTWVTRFGEDATVRPVFDTKGIGYYEVNDDGTWYNDLNDAIDAANAYVAKGSPAKIALVHSGILPAGTYTIPNKVTLLVPCDDARTTQGANPVPVYANLTNPSPYVTLEMASGANIVVASGGAIEAASRITAYGNNKDSNNGTPRGPHGLIQMAEDSTITLKPGANLYAWGFITGDGTVEAESGATVYECFQVKSWRGGTATVGMAKASTLDSGTKALLKTAKVAYDSDNHGVFPFSQYYIQNVEANLAINSGATEKVLLVANADNQAHYTLTTLIGTSNDALFQLDSGAKFTKQLDAQDQLVIDMDGGCTVNGIKLSFETAGQKISLDSKNYVFPLNDMAISVNSGTLTIASDVAIIPGTSISIAKGATAQVAEGKKCYIYDLDQWSGLKYGSGDGKDVCPVGYTAASGTTSKRTISDAMIDVNGTLSINGNVYTTTGGANITSSNGTGQVVVTKLGTETVTYQVTQNGSAITFVDVNVTPAKLKNADGTCTETAKAQAGTTYTYNETDGLWHVYAWHDAGSHTCTEAGTLGHYTCTLCVDSEGNPTKYFDSKYTVLETIEDPEDPAAHSWGETGHVAKKDATCTEAGNVEYWRCTVCSEIFSDEKGETPLEDTVIPVDPANHEGNTEVRNAKDATCAENGYTGDTYCLSCGEIKGSGTEIKIDANNHAHGLTKTDAKADTCTKEGNSEYYTCPDCGKYFSDEAGTTEIENGSWVIDDIKGHDFADDYVQNGDGTTHSRKCVNGSCTELSPATACSATLNETTHPTCTEPGEKTGTCVCGRELEEPVDALGHSLTRTEAKAATCTAIGWNAYETCSQCDHTTYSEIPALGHDIVTDAAVASTCTETGLTAGSHCSRCDGATVAQTVVPALGHTWNDGEVTTEPTCTEKGVKTFTCTVCTATKTEDVAAKGHTEVTDKAKDPTCTKTGLTAGSHCSVCNTVLVEQKSIEANGHNAEGSVNHKDATCAEPGVKGGTYCTACNDGKTAAEASIPATGHDIENHAAQAATCTEIGWDAYETCSKCDYTTYSEIPALDHDIVTDEAVAPTCTKTGLTEGSHCSRCDGATVAQTVVNALGHTWDEGKVTTEPTCTGKGVKTFTCTVCTATKTEDVAAKGHTEVIDEAKDPTCTKTGLTAGSHCSVCNTVLVEQKNIEANGHNTAGSVEHKDATCTETGVAGGTYCTACNEGKAAAEAVIEAKGHTWANANCTAPKTCSVCGATEGSALRHDYAAVVTAPTCTADGYTTYTCKVCNDTYKGNETKATGHTEVTDAAVDATCTKTGLTAGKHCSVCNEVLAAQAEIPALGHDIVIDAAKAPTCTETGLTAGSHCSRCDGATVAQEVVNALGHKWDGGEVTTTPTCTGAGVETFTCTVCGETETKASSANGHTVAIDAAVPATCETAGKTAGSHCSVCGATITAQETILATGHSWDTGVVTTEPTCTDNGVKTYTCQNDGAHTRTESIEAKGHNELGSVEHKDADCLNDGVEGGTYCTACGNGQEAAEAAIPAAGHNTLGSVEHKDATCIETGVVGGTYCIACDEGKEAAEAVIPATGRHTEDAGTTVGHITTYLCAVCGEELRTVDDTPPYTPPVVTPPVVTPPVVTPPDEDEEDIGDGDTPLVSRPFLFQDVKAGDWFYEPVKYVFDRGLVNGVSETTFMPTDKTTRGAIVTILYRMEGTPAAQLSAAFADVEKGIWYEEAVSWASGCGVVTGYSDSQFGPNDDITREQLAVMIYRYARMRGYDVSARADLSSFADAGRVSGWAAEAMSWAVGAGLIQGNGEGLNPNGTATRAEAATILMRFSQLYQAKDLVA